MITINLMGGLGNQLFQIFTTIAYCLRNNKEFKFEYSDILTIGIHRPTYWNNFLSDLKKYTVNHKLNFTLYKEPYFHFKQIPNNLNNIKLIGYFQSFKYFLDKYEEICDIINLKEQQLMVKKKYYPDMKNIISMHFRLGDYKQKQQYHPVLDINYYNKSIQKIIDITVNNEYNVLYFCEKDDNNIIEKHIQYFINMFPKLKFIKVDDTISDWEQMLIMSICDHNIIANSTFSWWGAYFNNNQDKIVCYPSIWFGPAMKQHNVNDLFIDKWIRIS